MVADGVVTYIPSCSAVSYGDVTAGGAAAFDITDTQYLQVGGLAGWGRESRIGCMLGGTGGRLLLEACCSPPLPPAPAPARRSVSPAPACPACPCASCLQKVIPSVVPGIILGIICALACLFFSLWM